MWPFPPVFCRGTFVDAAKVCICFFFFFCTYIAVLDYVKNAVIRDSPHFLMSHCQTGLIQLILKLKFKTIPVIYHLTTINLLFNMSKPLKSWCYPCVSVAMWHLKNLNLICISSLSSFKQCIKLWKKPSTESCSTTLDITFLLNIHPLLNIVKEYLFIYSNPYYYTLIQAPFLCIIHEENKVSKIQIYSIFTFSEANS